MAKTQENLEFDRFSGSEHVSRDSLMSQGRRLRIAALMASAMIFVALAGQGTASGLDVSQTPTLTTDPLSTTTSTVTNTVGTVTTTVGGTTGALPSTTTTPSVPSSPTTTAPTSTVTNTVKDTTSTIKKTTSSLPTSGSSTLTNVTSPTSTTQTGTTGTPSSPTRTLSSTTNYLSGSSGSGASGGTGSGTSGSALGGGSSGSGPSGPDLLGSGGGTTAGGGGTAGSAALSSIQVSKARSILDYLARGSGIGRPGGGAALAQLQNALSLLQGCFHGLTGRERRVLNLRAGLGGARPHSRSDVARRLHTTRTKVRGIEQSALFTLQGLADSTGCASGPGAAAAVADGYISPGELAQAPQLVTLANPAFQGAGHSQFSRLGTVPEFAPGLPAPRFGESRTSTLWAIQLLAVMFGIGLIGIVRGAPAITGWIRLRREGVPARAAASRSPAPAPRPAHRHGQTQAPLPEGARPRRREITS